MPSAIGLILLVASLVVTTTRKRHRYLRRSWLVRGSLWTSVLRRRVHSWTSLQNSAINIDPVVVHPASEGVGQLASSIVLESGRSRVATAYEHREKLLVRVQGSQEAIAFLIVNKKGPLRNMFKHNCSGGGGGAGTPSISWLGCPMSGIGTWMGTPPPPPPHWLGLGPGWSTPFPPNRHTPVCVLRMRSVKMNSSTWPYWL